MSATATTASLSHTEVTDEMDIDSQEPQEQDPLNLEIAALSDTTKPPCEVIVGTTSKCLPTSVPVLPILLSAILYSVQHLYSFLPIVRLFYLTRCLHP